MSRSSAITLPGEQRMRRGLRMGDDGERVRRLQMRLEKSGFDVGEVDGIFGRQTRKAVWRFQHAHGMKAGGKAGPLTQLALRTSMAFTRALNTVLKHPGENLDELGVPRFLRPMFRRMGDVSEVPREEIEQRFDRKVLLPGLKHAKRLVAGMFEFQRSWSASRQMRDMVKVAASIAAGRRPMGRCLYAVQNMLDRATYGRAGHGHIPRLPMAKDLAHYLNEGNRYASLGLKRLHITNPYDAPPGAIIVVRAGTPGTHHPTAGDVVVRGYGDHMYNDGEMGYGGRGNFRPGNDYVLGVYVPA